MPGMNGEPTVGEVRLYGDVLKKAMILHRLREDTPADMGAIQSAQKELRELINSKPEDRYWTKITDHSLKNATDLLQNSPVSPDIQKIIGQHLDMAKVEYELIKKLNVEGNPFTQITRHLASRIPSE